MNNTVSGVKVERLMKVKQFRKMLWRVRRNLAAIIDPKVYPRVQSSRKELGRDSEMTAEQANRDVLFAPFSDSQAPRDQAEGLWEQNRKTEAKHLLRRALRQFPSDTLLWMAYGNRLQAIGYYELAYEAYTNSVELDTGNLYGLEQFIEMANSRGESKQVKAALRRLGPAIECKPNRHRGALDFAIPYKLHDVLDIVANSEDQVAREVARLQATNGEIKSTESESLTVQEQALAQAIWCLARGRKDGAIRAIRSLPDDQAPASSLRLAIRRELARGRDAGAHKLLVEYNRVLPNDNWGKAKLDSSKVSTDNELATLGFPVPPRVEDAKHNDKSRVVYLLHNSLPYHSAGYSTRTHGLLKSLQEMGWNMDPVTRLGYPYDMPNFKKLGIIPVSDEVDGISYHRLSTSPSLELKRPIRQYVERYSSALKNYIAESKPFVIHAASNHWNGLTAVSVANELGLKSVYEVRGLWEITRASRDAGWADSDAYRYMARMEADAASNATRVIAITQALKDELVSRGVSEEKITVVPNGVDADRFIPVDRDLELAQELEIGDRTVVGYVGSVLDYEGLQLLAEAVAHLSDERDDFRVLVVGDGAALDELKQRTVALDIDHKFVFTGRVPHDLVEKYYSLIDIAPFPRLPLPVCEMVSPLKPFEAMSMRKAVVAADVAALTEIVEDGRNGLLHRKGDSLSLARCMEKLLDSPILRDELATNARQWVVEQRQWRQLGEKVGGIYRDLGGSNSIQGRHLNG